MVLKLLWMQWFDCHCHSPSVCVYSFCCGSSIFSCMPHSIFLLLSPVHQCGSILSRFGLGGIERIPTCEPVRFDHARNFHVMTIRTASPLVCPCRSCACAVVGCGESALTVLPCTQGCARVPLKCPSKVDTLRRRLNIDW